MFLHMKQVEGFHGFQQKGEVIKSPSLGLLRPVECWLLVILRLFSSCACAADWVCMFRSKSCISARPSSPPGSFYWPTSVWTHDLHAAACCYPQPRSEKGVWASRVVTCQNKDTNVLTVQLSVPKKCFFFKDFASRLFFFPPHGEQVVSGFSRTASCSQQLMIKSSRETKLQSVFV